MLQQEIVQTEIYKKYMESAAEKAIVRIIDYCKQTIQLNGMEVQSKKQMDASHTSSNVIDYENSAPAATKVNQEISSEAIEEG